MTARFRSARRRGLLVLGIALAQVVVLILVLSFSPLQAQNSKPPQDYALIYGTVWGPDNTPVAGVPVTIHPAGAKKPRWELVSDRRGEFAQRVPTGRQDYVIEADIKVPKGQAKPTVTVQIQDNEREDVGLHLTGPAPNQKQNKELP